MTYVPTAAMNALYDAILANPDDLALRLRFAGECEAIGDTDRAEFIRLQVADVERHRAGHASGTAGRQSLLEHRHRRDWGGPIATRCDAYGICRGFVEEIVLDAREFLARAPELYAMAPIRRLQLKNAQPVIEALCSSPHLRQIACLYLDRQHLGDHDVELIASSPHLGKLAVLSIYSNDVTLAGIEALAASPHLPALRRLYSGGNPGDVEETVNYDQGQPLYFGPSPHAAAIEAKYGRKPWLHTFEDNGREVFSDEY